MAGEARQVPRNIDQPNRMVEYVIAFLFGYYSVMFLTHKPLIAFFVGFCLVYAMYKVMIDKPEGQAYRVIYKMYSIGKMVPHPKKAPKFEL